MRDMSGDGRLSTNAVFQQLDLNVTRSLAAPVRPAATACPAALCTNYAPSFLHLAGQDADQTGASSFWPLW